MDLNNLNNDVPKTKSVETLTGDMVRVLETDKGGMIKKIIHEEEEKAVRKKNFSPESAKNRIFLFVGIILMAIAAGVLIFSLTQGEKASIAPVEPQFNPLIFTDKHSFLEIGDLSERDIAAAIADRVLGSEVKFGGVEGIYTTEDGKITNFAELIALLNGNFPKEGMEYVDDNFLIGSVNEGQRELFILLKTRSFADVFPHMRAWEGKMFSDLGGLFGKPLSPETSYLLTKDFEDGVAANKNARVLYDTEGNIVLMYVFADETSVVIADSIPVIEEIMTRLAGSKVRK